jgi:long-chain acyl-CoA synthetase
MMGLTVGKNSTEVSPPLLVDGKSIPEVFLRRVELLRDHRAFLVKQNGAYRPILWDEVYRKVVKLAAFLRSQNVVATDRVAVFSNTRWEWTVADLAIMGCGGITVPVYQSASQDEVEYVIQHSGAKLIFVEDPGIGKKLAEIFARTKQPLPIVFFQGMETSSAWSGPETAVFDYQALTAGPVTPEEESLYSKSAQALETDNPASIVYTSGTTGQPKGAVLTHLCFLSEMRGASPVLNLTHHDVALTFLPYAHVLGRAESFMGIYSGLVLAFAENISTIPQNMMEVKPTFICGVPRIYEKIYSKVLAEGEKLPAFKKRLFKWALKVGAEVADLNAERKPVPLKLMLKYRAADAAVFSKLRRRFGGRLTRGIAGGAPMSADLTRFFFSCGIPVLEGYGLTETSAAICMNTFDDYGFGSVGKPMQGMEVRIAADGEVLLRGPMVFREYYNNAEATQAVFTPDGWFCSGDIGELNERGSLRITDRKKELIVTSGGKNVAPQKLEGMLKQSPWISNAMVYGDKQKFLVALITLNNSAIKSWFQEQQIELPKDFTTSPQVENLVSQAIKEMNATVASYEGLKKFRIVVPDFSLETGEMTPSLKLKRKVITAKHLDKLKQMYGADAAGL